jgi:hypothetical protein
MTSMYELIIIIVGSPVNDYQADILYLTSSVISIILIMYFLYIFKLIAKFGKA